MATTVRTIDFLPEIFQTTPNKQFLSATLDTLVQQPKFDRVQGYIGSKFGYGVKATDQYVAEPNAVRTNYQLEPAIIFTKTGTKKAVDLVTYPGIIDAFKHNGAVTDNHNSLFSSEFYSWDSFVDLDKFINYSQYYWLPDGPEPVTISSGVNYSNLTFNVSSVDQSYAFTNSKFSISEYNPDITLVRGGTYQFNVSQNSPFYIQTQPGLTGKDAAKSNVSTREIFGVVNNGASNGTVTFTVPESSAQNDAIFPQGLEVDLATTLKFDEVHGKNAKQLKIDGLEFYNNKTIIFYGNLPTDTGFLGEFFDQTGQAFSDGGFEETSRTVINKNYYRINYLQDGDEFIIQLTEAGALPDNQTILVRSGEQFIGRHFVKSITNEITLVPVITAPLNTLYYQDGETVNSVGKINLIDANSADYIDVNQIIGQKTYTSPTKIKFTNGLKVQFQGNVVPESYLNDLYYVEGVGTSINLIPVSELTVPEKYTESLTAAFDDSTYGFDSISFSETFYVPTTPDYLTINRASLNRNAWSRSNRWFHADVLKLAIENNVVAPQASAALNSSERMAKRPILEFYPNLKLFNYGAVARGTVSYIDFYTKDAMNEVLGKVAYTPDGATSGLADGTTIIFANDDDINVRNKIYQVQIEKVDTTNSIVLNNVIRKNGTQVKFSIPAQTVPPTVGRNYQVIGNGNNNFNGSCVVTESTLTTVTLLYATDPGAFSIAFPTSMSVQSEIVLVPIQDIQYNDMVSVSSGERFSGLSFFYNGVDWMPTQQKTKVNTPPLFDLFDYNGISLGDPAYYPGTDFGGCTLFEYAQGVGASDTVLGFPISYTSIDNLGDVRFIISLNSQSFNWSFNGVSTTSSVSTSYVHNYASNTLIYRNIGWQTAVEASYQNQIFNTVYTGVSNVATFTLDVAIKDPASTKWPTITVYVDNQRVSPSEFTVSTGTNSTTVTLATSPAIGTQIDIMVYSDQVSKTGYYEIPLNLESNPFNSSIQTITLGDVRGHYKSICNNVSALEGNAFGSNNFRDLGNLVPYGTKIIQNSAPLVLPAAFTKNDNNNLINAISFNALEYEKFKNLIVASVETLDISATRPVAATLDLIMDNMTSVGVESSPFFWSDMIPSKTPTASNTYSFKTNLPVSLFQLSQVYDFTSANYNSVLVYLTRTTTGLGTVVTQLTKDVDYTVFAGSPTLEIIVPLQQNDSITINEYSQTYGNFVPSTPTKLGMYPSYIPEITLDETLLVPAFFIRGHDGSLNKLYGTVDDNGQLTDLRDKLLFEFEMRIYNNLKVAGEPPINMDLIVPGQSRTLAYTNEEFLQVYSTYFLNWTGLNRIDYKNHSYEAYNEFTWNYANSKLKTTNESVLGGHWKGVYLWLYDTVSPHTRPWEMLGMTKKPTWWDSHYGAAPYTSGNKLMWTDISKGVIWNNGNVIVNEQRIRPDLLTMLPVDSFGNLVSPFVSCINSYNVQNFSNPWKVGDIGPAEYAYRTSSSWPFDLMKITAMMKPAFFSYCFDLDVYQYDTEFAQFLTYHRLRSDFANTNFYGKDETSAQHSYVNWVIDYQRQYGIDGTSQLANVFSNADVRLTYRLAGFSDKSHLRFLLEKSSATSSALLIPEDSYDILLFNNQPTDTLVYSSVIVQKTQNGYKVYGNKQVNAYFIVLDPKLGLYEEVEVNGSVVNVPKNYSENESIVPYGTEFTTVSDLLTFVRGYGLYLENQGFQFNAVEKGLTINWTQMLAEVYYWILTGWEVGSTINLNPAASELTIDNGESIVQPLTLQKDNFILNQNLLPIQVGDLAIERADTKLYVNVLNSGDAITLFNCTVSTMEHVVVFDNTTVFNDLVYNPVTGLRQQRILMKGAKSADWNGTLNAAGFIISQDNINDWKPNAKYVKGTVVNYKNTYWMANSDVVQPNPEFDKTFWDETSYDMVRQNMLPNPSTKSVEAIKFYDSNQANLSNDADLLSFSLIGYRPRQYLTNAGLDDSTQVNLFKSMIESKGTNQSASGLNNITLNDGTLSYQVHENWAIKNSEYSGLNNHNFIEVTLDESILTGNPSIVSIVGDTNVDGSQQQIPLTNVKNYARNISSDNILTTLKQSSIVEKLPSAGYVNIADVVEMGYSLSDLANAGIGSVYRGDFVWLANFNGSWNVFTPVSIDVSLVSAINNMNGSATLKFSGPHGLTVNQNIGILNFNAALDGYYTVNVVTDLKTIVVDAVLSKSVHTVTGFGAVFLLQSHRVTTERDIASLPLVKSEFETNLVWVDENTDGDWTVYGKIPKYFKSDISNTSLTANFGTAVANVPGLGYMVGDGGNGAVYHYRDSTTGDGSFFFDYALSFPGTTFGQVIEYGTGIMVVGAPDENNVLSQVYIYRLPTESNLRYPVLEQTLSISGGNFGSAIAISGDDNVLYITAKDETTEVVFIFARNPDLLFTNLGFVLSQPTVLNTNYFSVSGDVLSEISQGQRVSFVTQYTSVGTTAANAAQFSDNFSVEGDVTSTIYSGLVISFSNASSTGNQLYTVKYSYYNSDDTDPGYDTTVIYVEETLSELIYNGTVVYTVSFSQDVTYTVITGIYDDEHDTTTFYTVEKIQHISAAGASVYHARVNYQYVGVTQPPIWTLGDNFGASLATNYDGSRLFIGSPNANFTTGNVTIPNVGRAWVVDTISENYHMKYDQNVNAAPPIFTVPWVPTANSVVYWNGKLLSSTKYAVIPGSIQTNVATTVLLGPIGFKAGDIITFRSYNVVYSQMLNKSVRYSDMRPGENFGASIACNTSGSELMVGAPNGVDDNNNEGMVVRFTCEGKRFGSMTGLIPADVVNPTYLFINGFRLNLFFVFSATSTFQQGSTSIFVNPEDAALMPAVGIITIQNIRSNNYTMEYTNVNVTTGEITFAIAFANNIGVWEAADIQVTAPIGSSYNIQQKINEAGIPNVFSFVNDDGRLIIKLIDQSLGQIDNKLNVMALNGNVVTQLGMSTFNKSQTITNPRPQHNSSFGSVVTFSESGSIAVGAPISTRYLKTYFDYAIGQDIHNLTTFDNNLTGYIDSFTGAGAVYMFDYIPCYNESLSNISNYVYAQSCNDDSREYGYLPMYGSSIDFRDNVLMVGQPKFNVNDAGGKVTIYRNLEGTQNWTAFRYPDSIADISQVKRVQLYDNSTDKTLMSLDYIDPLQGKLLGVVAENLDFVTSIDPAGYNSSGRNKGNSVWNKSQVGKMWFDTSTTKFVDYHQNDVAYNAKYWGQVFPGSSVDVYTWVESLTPPSLYADTTGTPYDISKYAVTFVTDANGALVPSYFYWVKNTNELYSLQGKTLSDFVLSGYIANPTNSGVPFMVPLRTNTFGLYNAQAFINGTTTNLHVGYSSSGNDSAGHTDFKLIRTDFPEDYVSGFPNPSRGSYTPTGIYEKLVDSFAGSDSFGETVPDPNLPKMLQVGTSIRPRQSMFFDRFVALKNFIEFTNSVIVNYPISETENLSFLNVYVADNFDTRMYWEYTYWWEAGYSSTTKTSLEVQRYADLLTLNPTEGLIVGVAKNGNNKREVYVYTEGAWVRVGLEDGTIKFLSSLYDYANNKIGFGNDFFDSSAYDSHPTIESRFIVRAINEQIFVNDLFKYRNQALILMFEYIQSENVSTSGYLPWLNKTSFADVSYNVRELAQDTKYRIDNSDLLEGYINEIKPYHVVIKEFKLGYTATDVVSGNATDFDIPTFYDTTLGRFVSPQLTFGLPNNAFEYANDDAIWDSSLDFSSWHSNFGLSLIDSPETVVAFVSKFLRPNDIELFVDNARGMPVAGTIRIDDELISYTSVDRETGKLSGLNRGIAATQPALHIPGVQIVMDVPSVNVLNTGRDYTVVPNVTAYIDTSIYPAPTVPAVLTPVMADNRVVGITIENPGQGYVSLPEIIIDPSISISFDAGSVNDSGIVVLNSSDFRTGDLVRSVGTGSNGQTFIPNGYYYINVLRQGSDGSQVMLFAAGDLSFVSFHKSYTDSLRKINPIAFTPTSALSSDYVHSIGVSAYAVTYANNTLVRGLRTTVKFDRTGYRSTVVPWTPNKFWSTSFFDLKTSTNTTQTLSDSVSYSNQVGTVSPAGGQGAIFTVYNWTVNDTYEATLTSAGYGYLVGDVITINGVNLQGSSVNNCVITVTGVDDPVGSITTFTVTGTPAVASLASLQGAVMPITDYANILGKAVLTVDYSYSGIQPGQVSGTNMFLYKVHDKYEFTDTSGAVFYIYRPTFTIDSVVSNYYMKVVNAGTGYERGQTLKVLGSLLGGSNGSNDAIITISEVSDTGEIYISSISGTPISEFTQYYVKAIDDTRLALYFDPTLRNPVPYDNSFIWNGSVSYETNGYGYPGTDYAYLPVPLHNNLNSQFRTNSLVSYANTIWQCIQSNHDSEFDVTKWKPLSQSDLSINALDRIEGFYQPSLELPAKDIQQLLKGTAYPNPTYLGNAFSPEDVLPLDTILETKPFYPINPNIKYMIYDGTQYLGIVDTPIETVLIKSDDSIVWHGTKLADTSLGVTGISYFDDLYTDELGVTHHNFTYVITTTTSALNVLVSFDSGEWLSVGTEANFDKLDYDIGEFDTTTVVVPATPLNNTKFFNGTFYAVGNGVLTSTDGLLWKQVLQFYSRLTNTLNDIDYIDTPNFTGYIAVGLGGEIVAGANTSAPIINPITRIVTSTDGVNWETQSGSLSRYALNSITHSDDLIVVAGENAQIFYSMNGSNWVQATISGSSITTSISSIVYGSNLFVAVGAEGLILTSSNGMTWTQRTNSAITINDLHHVMFDGTFFYASGDDDTILRSVNGTEWVSQSNLAAADPTYIVKGSDFLFGYGPEELVPGVVTDALSIQVNTAPGAYWNTDASGVWYNNTGFSVSKVLGLPDEDSKISFETAAVNPVAISVFVYEKDPESLAPNSYTRIYETRPTNLNLPYTFSIDWFNRTVTLLKYQSGQYVPTTLLSTQELLVEVYEVGNAVELARGNSDLTPIRVDDLTGHSMIVLEASFQTINISPLVIVNGVKLEFNEDFTVLPYDDGTAYPPMKLQFNTTYDPDTIRVVYSVFADSTTPTNDIQYNYSFPETEIPVMIGEDFTTYQLTLDATGANPDNAFVELDGIRLIPTTEYDISGNLLTLVNPIDETRTLSYTTFNDTSRLYLTTVSRTAPSSGNLVIDVPNPAVPGTMPDIFYTDVNTTWVYINGRRIQTSRYSYDDSNNLTVTDVSNGDKVLVTAMIDGGSPNPTAFKMFVDKSGETSVFRANPQDRTWLTRDFSVTDTTMQVADVSRLVEVITVTNAVDTIDPAISFNPGAEIGFLLNFSINKVSHVSGFNITTGQPIASNFIKLRLYKGASGASFTDPNTSLTDIVQLTLYIGNVIVTNGEKIQFAELDPVTNTISGLIRNIQHTVTTSHAKYDFVYGLGPSRKLNPATYNTKWSSSNYVELGDPLQISDTEAGLFLNTNNN